MRLYGLIVLAGLYIIASFGVVLPFLISAASNVLVMVGIAYIISMPVVIYAIIKYAKRPTNKEIKIENS